MATLTRALGLFTLNPCRVVYVDAAEAGADCAAFAYGTLPGHAEIGEERFRVTRDLGSDEVRYELLAFSRPGPLHARLGYACARRLQRRFARASLAALAHAAGTTV